MARVRVKICGVTTPEDVRLAADLGADAVGFNFYAKSPRYVDPRSAGNLLQAVPPLLKAVGVFVDLKIRQVCALAYQLGLHSVQCFADVNDADSWQPFLMIAAFRIKDESSLAAIEHYLDRRRELGLLPGAILLDAHVEGQLGGTGRTAPWQLLADFSPGVPVILAGGLTPENVAQAIHTVKPWAVDVASGVESSPGKKDSVKMRRFIENAHAAALNL
jgi:phosphoribosylanthranilate isomerase